VGARRSNATVFLTMATEPGGLPLLRIRAALPVLLAFGCGPAEPPESDPLPAADTAAINVPLRTELLRLGLLDRTIRTGFAPATAADTAFIRASLSLDSALTRRLGVIVREHGWPTRSMVGDTASEAASLILTHSPSDVFQRQMLPLLDSAAMAGEASANHAAMLTDRVRTMDGKPQLYGTQFRILAGALMPYPIEEPERLDERRAGAGLMPMVEYVRILRGTYAGPVLWPQQSVTDPPGRAGPSPDTTAQPSA
jgi:hypothetical protein